MKEINPKKKYKDSDGRIWAVKPSRIFPYLNLVLWNKDLGEGLWDNGRDLEEVTNT